MPDDTFLTALSLAIKYNELGDSSPYCLSFARLGNSGASFGIFQADTHVTSVARTTLAATLEHSGIEPDAVARIIGLLSQACRDGNPLTSADTTLVNDALSSTQGRSLVDAMDGELLVIVQDELQSTKDAAAAVELEIETSAQLYIALWVNMTGRPNCLNRWIGGADIGNNVACPVRPAVTSEDMARYLQACKYFTFHPRAFLHMRDSVNLASQLAKQLEPD